MSENVTDSDRRHYHAMCERALRRLDVNMRCKALHMRLDGTSGEFGARIADDIEYLDCIATHYYCDQFGVDYCQENADG